jgi:lipoprotein-releasing system permease protein
VFERFVAFRYLRARKGGGFAYVVNWFSLIGIAIGVATLIVVTSVMNGFKDELFQKIVGMRGHIAMTSSFEKKLTNYDKVKNEAIKSSKEIESIIPIIERQVILSCKGNLHGIMAHGLSLDGLKSKDAVAKHINLEDLENFKENSIFVGQRLAETLGLRKGDVVSFFSPCGLRTPIGSFPKQDEFKVIGTFETGMHDYDKNIVIMPLDAAQEFFGLDKFVDRLEIFVKDFSHSSIVAQKISEKFSDLMVLDWQHSDAAIFHAVTVEKNVMSLILGMIILVAAFNIISGLTMLSNSKKKDIGILRTIGASRKSILIIFFYIGASIGIAGTAIGVGLGLFVSLNIDEIKKFLESLSGTTLFSGEIYFLSQIPSKTDLKEVCIIAVASVLLCFLAALYPARKASKSDPVDCLY